MTLTPHKAELLKSYVMTLAYPPDALPWIAWGNRVTWLSRWYLWHLATGGKCHDVRDLILVEMLLVEEKEVSNVVCAEPLTEG